MINLVGAYLFSMFLIGIAFKRPSFTRGEATLKSLPAWIHLVILFLLISISLSSAFKSLRDLPFISMLAFIFESLNIWVHEAGHIYWSWGGKFLAQLGGTLNEILFPLGFAIYCVWKNCEIMTSYFTYWLGHNCFGISIYMNDARAKELPLFGMIGKEGHDWANILGTLNLLEYDHTFSSIIWFVGLLIVGWSLWEYCRLVFYSNLSLSDTRNTDAV